MMSLLPTSAIGTIPSVATPVPGNVTMAKKAKETILSCSTPWLNCRIFQNIHSFLLPGATGAIPCVCRAWRAAVSKMEKALDWRVREITIYASNSHAKDNAIILALRELSEKPGRITFLESAPVFESPENHRYSLEEFSHDHPTSLNSVVRVVSTHTTTRFIYDSLRTTPENQKRERMDELLVYYREMIGQLYEDPHFKETVYFEKYLNRVWGTLSGIHCSNFMARKVISKLQSLGKNDGIHLRDYSVYIYAGGIIWLF
jgi:hypothetical protein